MICPSCGAELADSAKFCGKCGASIADAPPAVKEWFIYINNKNMGPYGVNEVRSFLAEGKISGTTNVWKEGMDGWQPAGTIQELTSAGRPGPAKGADEQEQLREIRKKAREFEIKQRQRLAEEKKKLKREKKKGSFARAMGYETGKVAKWYESPIVVLLCLISPFLLLGVILMLKLSSLLCWFAAPLLLLGIILMLKSRHFPFTFKLLVVVVIVFVLLLGGHTIYVASKFNIAGLARDESALPTGFSETSFKTIELGMKKEYVYYMLGDEAECGDTVHKDGTVSMCKWTAYDKNNNLNYIYVNFQKGVVVEMCWEEKVYQKECTKLDEGARKVLRLMYAW